MKHEFNTRISNIHSVYFGIYTAEKTKWFELKWHEKKYVITTIKMEK